ncbi:carbohydrate ABC transporter permease [Labrys wisconsinensis]|uniref:Multiple sugar transport system permease protein n=1 Tax=Labrys wisconsinensis TaxID=425677 RepID=A0ABU0JLY9_9HYPH|nr:sugar ABC transporter permease [Labrys wisconsinensis]MDQ0475283.1 multiple sugar transport system permease protein [Labrys wisconsinensis]
MTLAPPLPRPSLLRRLAEPRWNNWPAALALFLIGAPLAITLLPPAVSFWAAGALAALLCATLVVHAWGRHTGGLLVAPAIALLVLMNVFPLLWSFGLTFFSYRTNRARPPSWVGLENYAKVLTDAEVWDRLHNTVIMVILTVTTQMVVGFLLALLFAKQFPLRRVLLILVLTPMMLSFVAVGAFFRYYYDPTFGLVSQAVRLFTGEPFILMQTIWGARAGIVFADAWMWSPFVMLLVLAGLVSVPKYLYEAAAIDRASRWRQFWSITFPYIRGLLLLALLFRTIEAFKLFDLVFLLTQGGPGTATETIALRVYRIAFENNKTSDAAALAYILLFTVIVLTNLYLYFARQRVEEA